MTRLSAADVSGAGRETQTPKPPDTDRLRFVSRRDFDVMPHIPRDVEQMPPELRQTLRGLLYDELNWPLYLHGDAGTGKTCAGLCLVDRIDGAAYVTVERLIGWVLAQDSSAWEWMGRASLVVVDELGTRTRDSDLEYAAVKRIADIREHRRAVWISNHEPAKMETLYDDRIYNRICTGTLHHLTGESRRQGFKRRVI